MLAHDKRIIIFHLFGHSFENNVTRKKEKKVEGLNGTFLSRTYRAENQIKSNQIKSNQIKFNFIETIE